MSAEKTELPFMTKKNLKILEDHLWKMIVESVNPVQKIISVKQHEKYILFINYLCNKKEFKQLLPIVKSTFQIGIEIVKYSYISSEHFDYEWKLSVVETIHAEGITDLDKIKIMNFYNIHNAYMKKDNMLIYIAYHLGDRYIYEANKFGDIICEDNTCLAYALRNPIFQKDNLYEDIKISYDPKNKYLVFTHPGHIGASRILKGQCENVSSLLKNIGLYSEFKIPVSESKINKMWLTIK